MANDVPSMTGDAEPTAKVLFRVPGEGDSAYVEMPFSLEEQLPTFQRVVEKSGNRTVRVSFNSPVEAGNLSDALLQGLVRLGCSYEGATTSYMSINVPPDVELEAVRSYLMEHDAEWEHADPTFEDLFPEGR